jgi:hypothetical protein
MPIYVNPILPAGTAFPTNTPVLTTHANYVTGDYVGTDHTPMTFASCVMPGGSGWVVGAALCNGTVSTIALELWLFNATVDPGHDSDAFSITDAEAKTCVAVIPFSTYYASALNSVSQSQPDGGSKRFVSTTGSLFGCLVARGTLVAADGDITVRLSIMQD